MTLTEQLRACGDNISISAAVALDAMRTEMLDVAGWLERLAVRADGMMGARGMAEDARAHADRIRGVLGTLGQGTAQESGP